MSKAGPPRSSRSSQAQFPRYKTKLRSAGREILARTIWSAKTETMTIQRSSSSTNHQSFKKSSKTPDRHQISRNSARCQRVSQMMEVRSTLISTSQIHSSSAHSTKRKFFKISLRKESGKRRKQRREKIGRRKKKN